MPGVLYIVTIVLNCAHQQQVNSLYRTQIVTYIVDTRHCAICFFFSIVWQSTFAQRIW